MSADSHPRIPPSPPTPLPLRGEGSQNASEADRPPQDPGERDSAFAWLWRYGRTLAAPLLIWVLLVGALMPPLFDWLQGEDRYDRAALQEWLDEARNSDHTLAELVAQYTDRVDEYIAYRRHRASKGEKIPGIDIENADLRERTDVKRDEIYQHLRALGEPATKMYPGLLPLFPVIYRLEVAFSPGEFSGSPEVILEGNRRLDDPIIWDSGQEPSAEYHTADFPLKTHGKVKVYYQIRAWNKRRSNEQLKARRLLQLGLLALAATGFGLAWLMLVQSDQRERQRQRETARVQIDLAERQRLEAERQRVETERQLLEQALAREDAERQALELKSHLYASIGIMAGSYAHNIKNLLVRPNDLLRRCLETDDVSSDQQRMLREVQQTLGTVTERLQQILHTVRRDPSSLGTALERLDLNATVRALETTWRDLAADRWHLDLVLDLAEGELPIAADASHLQQAVENLLFNARDATFEMRNHLREQARRGVGLDAASRKQKVIEAASWRGRVVLRTRRSATGEVLLEVSDNGAGMSEEVRRRCTETHFSTKRDNALYQGHSTGMGLGLSFVLAILEYHQAKLEIESEPQQRTTFRGRFPAFRTGAGEQDGSHTVRLEEPAG